MCNLQVRLVGGASNKQGLVQVYYNNNWHWVCGEQWDKHDSNVTCQWLGYSGSSEAYTDTARDGANGTTWMTNVNCTGDERSLFSCVHDGWLGGSCASNQMAGVRCTGPEVRLVGGEHTLYQGQVEVLFNGVWAGICHNYNWDFPEANVACRQLGYHGAVQPTYHGPSAIGIDDVRLTNVHCLGNETSILNCTHDWLGVGRNCWSGEVGVRCSPSVRLVRGLSARKGLVQVYRNNTWGWICAKNWKPEKEANVVCKELGYTGASSVNTFSPNEQGNGSLWINNFQCAGNESSLSMCVHDGYTNNSCFTGGNVGVVCTGPEARISANDSHSLHPRVEILFGGFWGPICGDHWDQQDANVVCRQLGHDEALAAPVFHGISRIAEVCLRYLQCTGNETSVLSCSHQGWKLVFDVIDGETEPPTVGNVICTPTVRIVGTTATPGEGLVQVYHNNMWKLVCDEQWDTTDADVACRQLGYQSSSTALSFPISNQRKEHWTAWLNNVQCVGDESSLLSCKHGSLLQKSTCTTKQMAGMKCSGIQVRLVDMCEDSLRSGGVVEVLFGGVWGTVCPDSWDLNDANVVCQQLGYEGAQSTFDPYACEGDPPVNWMSNVQCKGNETSLSQCKHMGWNATRSCPPYSSASVICIPLGALGPPEFVSSDFVNIDISWNSSRSSKFTVQMWNKDTMTWASAYCKESLIADSCVRESLKATVVNLKPSTTYYFRIFVSRLSISTPSGPMKTKNLDPPQKPTFMGSTTNSITIKWKSTSLLNVTYAIQIKRHDDYSWAWAKCDTESLVPNICTVRGTMARVIDLQHNAEYYFRVCTISEDVKSDFSQPSKALRTTGDVRYTDSISCCVLSFLFLHSSYS